MAKPVPNAPRIDPHWRDDGFQFQVGTVVDPVRIGTPTHQLHLGQAEDSILIEKQVLRNTHDEYFLYAFGQVQEAAVQNSIDKGWHKLPFERGASHLDVKFRKLMLIVGEVAEVSEALREGNPESKKIPGFTCEEEEMADIILRAMDYAAKEGLRLAEAVLAKHKFNTTRPHKHGGKLV